jgi:diguanylate cyclase (GGDEF)-like protein/PAS domain S-box-containing protein
MIEQAAVPLIVMTRSEDHVEAINATMRNAGHAVHCTWLRDAHDLGDALTQLNPELLVVFIEELAIDLASIMKFKTQNAPEMPVIVVRERVDEAAIAEAMRLGAHDVVTLSNRSRLQSVATRELRTYRLERALNTTLSSAKEYREQLARFLEGSADAITHVQEGIIVDANKAWLELFGYSGEDALTGMPLMDLFELESHAVLKGALVASLQGKWTDHPLNVQALLSDGSGLPLVLTLTRADIENEPAIRICIPSRQDRDSGIEERLAKAVENDAATGFLQQRYLIAALRSRLVQSVKGGVREFAFIKPDHFAAILRGIGVLASDEFLAQLADIVRKLLAPGDLCGKFGGNGFLVLLERGTARDVETWAENLLTRVAAHEFTIGTKAASASVSIGLTALASADIDIGASVQEAVDANKRSRDLGGNQVCRAQKTDTETRVQAYDKIWVRHIKSALMENRFRLVQQPIASLLGADKGMFDVLVRMLDEQGGEVLPTEFIAAAERNDLMKNIDRWVIGASLAFCTKRDSECIFLRVSQDTVLDRSLLPWLESQLRAFKVSPKRLCFQVSEELAAQHTRATRDLAQSLGKLGFRFALEHFGTGQDPLKLLAEIDVHFIKVDGSLMQGLATNQMQQHRIKSLVDAAKLKDVETIAERVEDANTMAVLWQLGIEFIQGYFVNAPEDVTMSSER